MARAPKEPPAPHAGIRAAADVAAEQAAEAAARAAEAAAGTDDAEEIAERFADTAERDAFGELVQALDGVQQATIYLYRRPFRGAQELCESLPVEAFDPSAIRDRWGPGTYIVRAQALKGRGWIWSKTITLAAPYNPVAAQPVAAPQGNRDGDADRQMVRDVVVALAGRPAEQRAPGANIAEIITAIAGAVTVVGALVKELMPPRAEVKAQSVKEIIDGMEAVMEMRERYGTEGGGAPEPNPILLLQPLIEPAARMMERYAVEKEKQIPPPSPAGGNGASAGGGGAGGAGAGPRSGDSVSSGPAVPPSPVLALRAFMGPVLQYARSGADPEVWGRIAGAQGGTQLDVLDAVLDALGDEFFPELERVYPETIPHRAWLERFITAALPLDDDDQGEGRPGDDGPDADT